MKRIVPYIINLFMLLLGILLPFYFSDSVRFFFFHTRETFCYITFTVCLILFIIFDVRYRSVLISQTVFYLTVFLFYSSLIYDTLWTHKEFLLLNQLFYGFSIAYVDDSTIDYSLFRVNYNYPEGILYLTIKNGIIQSIAYWLSKKIRGLIKTVKEMIEENED